MAKTTRQYSQRYIDKQYASMKNPVITKQEYADYLTQVKKANNKLMRGMREGKLVTQNLYSTSILGITSRQEFENRKARVNATLQRNAFKKRNDARKLQFLTNLDKYIGDRPDYNRLRSIFEQLTAPEIEEYMDQAPEVSFDLYYGYDDNEVEDYFEGQEMGIVNSLDRFLDKKLKTWKEIDEQIDVYDYYNKQYDKTVKDMKSVRKEVGQGTDEQEDIFDKATQAMLKQRKSLIQKYNYLVTQLNTLQVEWDL